MEQIRECQALEGVTMKRRDSSETGIRVQANFESEWRTLVTFRLDECKAYETGSRATVFGTKRHKMGM